MDFADEVAAEMQQPIRDCWLTRLYDSDPDLFGEVLQAFRSDATSAAISRALVGRGMQIRAASVADHRRGQCGACRSLMT